PLRAAPARESAGCRRRSARGAACPSLAQVAPSQREGEAIEPDDLSGQGDPGHEGRKGRRDRDRPARTNRRALSPRLLFDWARPALAMDKLLLGLIGAGIQ